MPSSQRTKPVAIVTGASAGLGLETSIAFAGSGYDLVIVGRDSQRLDAAADRIRESQWEVAARTKVVPVTADVTDREQCTALAQQVRAEFGRLDVLVNNVGTSDRGLTESLTAEHLDVLFRANVISALNGSQACLPLLKESGGQIVNIGSLAAKVAPRFLGGYAIVKHALAALTQQMRLELRETGVNVILVSPGPIQRDDAGHRYRDLASDELPASAQRPAGGTRVKGLPPAYVARRIVRACAKRSSDVILPGYLRWVIATGHLCPSLGDRMLLWFTRSKDER